MLDTAVYQRKGFDKKVARKFAKFLAEMQEPISKMENYFALADVPEPQIINFERLVSNESALFLNGPDSKKEAAFDIIDATKKRPMIKQGLFRRVTDTFIKRAKGITQQKDNTLDDLAIS